jgi:hypothetical protein
MSRTTVAIATKVWLNAYTVCVPGRAVAGREQIGRGGCSPCSAAARFVPPNVAELEGLFAALERWQTAYLAVCFLWAAAVVIFFPPLFGYR